MNTTEPRAGNSHDQIEISEFYELKTELRAHAATDQLQFDMIKEKLLTIGKALERISWAGWAIAGGVSILLYHTFAK